MFLVRWRVSIAPDRVLASPLKLIPPLFAFQIIAEAANFGFNREGDKTEILSLTDNGIELYISQRFYLFSAIPNQRRPEVEFTKFLQGISDYILKNPEQFTMSATVSARMNSFVR